MTDENRFPYYKQFENEALQISEVMVDPYLSSALQ